MLQDLGFADSTQFEYTKVEYLSMLGSLYCLQCVSVFECSKVEC
jgi:hypothetical protein